MFALVGLGQFLGVCLWQGRSLHPLALVSYCTEICQHQLACLYVTPLLLHFYFTTTSPGGHGWCAFGDKNATQWGLTSECLGRTGFTRWDVVPVFVIPWISRKGKEEKTEQLKIIRIETQNCLAHNPDLNIYIFSFVKMKSRSFTVQSALGISLRMKMELKTA